MEPTKNNEHLDALVKQLSEQLTQGKPLTGQDGVFTPLLKRVIEASLEGEMDAHLEDEKGTTSNRRNGRGSKNVQSSLGGFEIFTPRDRDGSFSPQTLKKRQRRITSDVDAKILSLYSRGMSYRDIQAHLGAKYKVIFRSWHSNWDRLTNFYKYPPALRRVIYTNNPIESYHRMVRKVTKTKGAFSSENAIVKQIYLATINAQTKWSGTMYGWSSVRRDLVDYFEDKFLTPDTL